VRGHAAVRDYWTRQWAAIDPRVEPVAIAELDDDRVRVDVHQVVRDLGGTVVADARVGHTYTFGDHGLVVRMDIDD
jgi:AMMECR1 domain-containing protein